MLNELYSGFNIALGSLMLFTVVLGVLSVVRNRVLDPVNRRKVTITLTLFMLALGTNLLGSGLLGIVLSEVESVPKAIYPFIAKVFATYFIARLNWLAIKAHF